MTDYWVAYRLHGPVQIETKVDLGDAVIKPGTGSPSVSGLLEIIYHASDRDEAEQKASGEIEKQANRIVSSLAFTFDEGLILGDHYKIREADAPNKSKTDSTLKAGQRELEVGEQVYQNIKQDLKANNSVSRGLNWYSITVSTENHEDRLVAAWTGLEAVATNQQTNFNFSPQVEQELRDAKNDVLNGINAPNSEKHTWIAGFFGKMLSGLKEEDNDEAVSRITSNEIDDQFLSNVNDIEKAVDEVYDARNKIVHAGLDISDAVTTANKAEELLKELLIALLPDAFSGFIGKQAPNRRRHLVDPDDFLRVIFQNDFSQELSREEIWEGGFAITRDLYDGHVHLQNLVGSGEPLNEVSGKDNTYRLNRSYFN
jgi:hypothetical protein